MTTRRKFLGAAAGMVMANPSASPARAATRGMRKLGFALCGLGSLSTRQIAPALQKTSNCRLAGIITGTPAKVPRWREQYAIPEANVYSYDTMHRMADNPDIDVVYVVTPNALHLDHAVLAAKAGKHVFCEKPMEVSVARCRQMIDALHAADRRLGIAYRLRFEPHHLECARLARSGELGAVRVIDAHFGFRIEPGVWRLNRALAGGGPLMDLGIYCLQATRYLTGEEPSSVSAITTGGDPARFSEVEASVLWHARFPGGTVSRCSASYDTAGGGYFRVLSERGWIGMEPAFNYDGLRASRSDGRSIEFPEADQFAAEMDDFAKCILSRAPTRVPGEEGLRDVRIMTAIYESARAGRPVELTAA